MTIAPTHTQPAYFRQQVASRNKNASETAAAMPNAAQAKQPLNVGLPVASAGIFFSAGQQSQTLLFRSVMDRITQALSLETSAADNSSPLIYTHKPQALPQETSADNEHANEESNFAAMLGTKVYQNAAMNQDYSPEGTANRIVQLSTASFNNYLAQNPNEDTEAVVRKFVDTILSGLEKGYNDAKGILEGQGSFNGDVKGSAEKTLEFIQKGFNDFLEKTLAVLKPVAKNPEGAESQVTS